MPVLSRTRKTTAFSANVSGVDPEEVGKSGRRQPKRSRQATQQMTSSVVTTAGSRLLGAANSFDVGSNIDVSLKSIREMIKKDGQVSSAFQAILAPLRNSRFIIKPPDGDEKTGKEETDFIRDVFTLPPIAGGLETPIMDVINECLNALRDGFSVHEKVWHVVDWRGQQRWMLRRLSHIPSEQVKFAVDREGKLQDVIQSPSVTTLRGGPGKIVVPADKTMVFTLGHSDNPFHGVSMFLPAYYHYDKKHKLYYIMHLAVAINAIGARIGTYPRRATKEEITKFQEDLANFGTNSAMVKQDGYDVDSFESKRPLADLMPAINHHDQMIAKSILPHFIGLGLQSTPIGDDASMIQLFELSLNGILANLASIFNTIIIPELIQYNFGTNKYPVMQFDAVPFDRIKLASDILLRLIATKSVQPTPEFLQGIERTLADRVGIRIDYSDKDPKALVPPVITAAPAGAGRPKAGSRTPVSVELGEDDLTDIISGLEEDIRTKLNGNKAGVE